MSDRLRRDIDEILSKYEKFPLREPLPRRLRRKASELATAAGQLLAAPLRYVTAGRLMLLGVILVLVAYFGLGGGSATQAIIIAGLIIFALAFAVSLRRRSPYVEQRWRGRPLDLQEPSVGARLRAWWGRWRGRRRSPR
jgi:VIT1/CCC1 family predicted Fe2+/Mn2+ transporter